MLTGADPEPSPGRDLRALALHVVAAERYAVLGTVSPDGEPWACPVWFAHDGLACFYWLSRPERTHSVNIAHQSRISLVVFDSSQPAGIGLGFYATADAANVPEGELDEALTVVSARSLAHGGKAWDRGRLESSPLRLYAARPVELWLNPGEGTDVREPVPAG